MGDFWNILIHAKNFTKFRENYSMNFKKKNEEE